MSWRSKKAEAEVDEQQMREALKELALSDLETAPIYRLYYEYRYDVDPESDDSV